MELVGLAITAVAGVIFVGLFIVALLAYILGAFILLILGFGLLCLGLGYLIYAGTVDNPSIEGYFGLSAGIINWGNSLINIINTLII